METVNFIYKNINRKMKNITGLYELLNAIAILENMNFQMAFNLYLRTLHTYAYGPSEDNSNIRCILKEAGYSANFSASRFNKYALVRRGNHFYALIKENNQLNQYGLIDPLNIDDSDDYVMYLKDFNYDYSVNNRKSHFNSNTNNITYTNLNPMGNLVGDCSVRALALAMHKDWHEALDILAKEAYLVNELHFNKEEVVEKVLKEAGFVKYPHFPVLLTCKQFCEKMDKLNRNEDILLYAGDFHITTVTKVKGKYTIVDSWDCSNLIAGSYFILEKKIEEINYVDKMIIHPVFKEGFVYKQEKDKLTIAFNDEDRVLTIDWVKKHCKII